MPARNTRTLVLQILTAIVLLAILLLVQRWQDRAQEEPATTRLPKTSGAAEAKSAGSSSKAKAESRERSSAPRTGSEKSKPLVGTAEPARKVPSGEQALINAIRNGESDVWVQAEGEVVKVLPDDSFGDPHQRFLVRISSGDVVLIAHNLDLADRVPVREGDRVAFNGEFEWNDKGGVVHWTHRDPSRRKTGGWIRHNDKDYR
jgi:translation initiation factor IF-1